MCTTAFLQIYPVSHDSVFTEILRNRIDRNRNGFARFGFVWTGPKSLKTLSGYIPLLLTCAFSDPMDNCVPPDVDFNRALCIPTECIPTGEFVWVPVDII